MQIESITIENFRGFRNFHCSGFSPVTLIGGRNNCGKSSLLEAVHLLQSSSSGATLTRLNRTRQQLMRTWADLETAFTDGDSSHPICIRGFGIGGGRKEVLVNLTTKRVAEYSPDSASDDMFRRELTVSSDLDGDRYQARFFRAKANKHGAPGTFTEDTWVSVDDTRHNAQSVYVTAHSRSVVSLGILAELIRQKRQSGIVAVLRDVDSRIEGITLSGDDILVDVVGVSRLLPLKMLGDGMMRIISILVAIEQCQGGGVVCVDEIDNGLHYSAYLTLLHAMVEFAREKQVQLIVTTHNREFMQRLSDDEESAELLRQGGFSYLNLIRYEDDVMEVIRYDWTQFAEAIQNGMEVR